MTEGSPQSFVHNPNGIAEGKVDEQVWLPKTAVAWKTHAEQKQNTHI